jgi:formate hydrogenlyase subunit 3/multisubunit Na+/H+ antiporter MnhD subunit
MNTIIKSIINWFDNLFSSTGTVSSKRVAFIMVVASAIVWLSSSLYSAGITDNWVAAFNILVISVIGGYVSGSVLGEKKKKKQDEDNIPSGDMSSGE